MLSIRSFALGVHFLLVATVFPVLAQTGSTRLWTNREGKQTEGTLEGVDGGKVKLIVKGRSFVLDFAQLSDADQAWLKTQMPDAFTVSINIDAERTWINLKGAQTTGRFQALEEGTVRLLVKGRPFNVPLDQLSQADQEWIAEATRPPAAEHETPHLNLPNAADLAAGMRYEFETDVPADLEKWAMDEARGSDYDKDISMKRVHVGWAVPPGFDPSKENRILVISMTATSTRPSNVNAMRSYIRAASEAGWCVLGADTPSFLAPGIPTHRMALAEAALLALGQKWPNVAKWPVATAGFSGGGKYSGWLAGYFASKGRTVCGMMMTGTNEDMATKSLEKFSPDRKSFLATKIFMSTGDMDNTASPERVKGIIDQMKKTGFNNVRLEVFPGPHKFHVEHVAPALAWFSETDSASK